MKRRALSLLLILCLLLTACGTTADPQQEQPVTPGVETDPDPDEKNPTDPTGSKDPTDPNAPEDPDSSTDPENPGTSQDPEDPEPSKPSTDPDQPGYEPPDIVSPQHERIRGAASHGLSVGMEDVLLALQELYYQSLTKLEVQPCGAYFSADTQAKWHEAVWRSLIAVREASLIDLHLVDYDFTLRCTGARWKGDREIHITAVEDVAMWFAATADVTSRQQGVVHTFVLSRTGQDTWKIKEHMADDNPYASFSYDSGTGCDKRLSTFLSNIAQRQSQRGGAGGGTSLTWDHDYDRQAALSYMRQYALQRNGDWMAYDNAGGNCQNFGSQVLYAGGIPMDQEGDAQWYWHSHGDQNYSWINVGYFLDYARDNTGYGLVADADANYYDGQTGDILVMGNGNYAHTTVISRPITDGSGATVDYLICSNTTDYLDFPASAYYYTQQWVVRIFGWNDMPVIDPGGDGGDGGDGGEEGETTDPTDPADPGDTETPPENGETPVNTNPEE